MPEFGREPGQPAGQKSGAPGAGADPESVLLLTGSGEVMVGTAEQVLSCENLSRAYGCDIRRVVVEDGRAVFYPA